MSETDDLVRRIGLLVGDALADERVRRDSGGLRPLGRDEERALARAVAGRELDRVAAARLSAGSEVMDAATEAAVTDAVLARALGMGRIQPLLDDPTIDDIHIRGCAPVWVKHADGTRAERAPVVDSDDELVDLLRVVAARAGRSERRFDTANPELNLQLADGSRLFAAMDVSARPTAVIRKHRFRLASLGQLRELGMLERTLERFLAAAVRARRNVVIAGGTGSGKTTLLRALLNEVPRTERIVTIEDAYELALDRFAQLHPDHDMLQTRPANIEGAGAIGLVELTRMALRMDPDRVVVGEVRGAEAFPMLLAMGQGNDGSMCTMHADSSRSVFPKLAAYVSMAGTGLPVETLNLLVATSVHLVVHIGVARGHRQVTSVREVVGAEGAQVISNEVFAPGAGGSATPAAPVRAATLAALEAHGFDAALLRGHAGSDV